MVRFVHGMAGKPRQDPPTISTPPALVNTMRCTNKAMDCYVGPGRELWKHKCRSGIPDLATSKGRDPHPTTKKL